MKKKKDTKQIVIFQAKSGAIELRGDFERETIWATQAEIASVFVVTPQNITMHLRNIYRQKELQEQATCKEFLQVQDEDGRNNPSFENLEAGRALQNNPISCGLFFAPS